MKTINFRLKMQRILITGVSGMLGHQLYKQAQRSKHKVFGTLRNTRLHPLYSGKLQEQNIFSNVDVFKMKSLFQAIDKAKPSVIVNCIGAIKQIDWKESDTVYLNSFFPHYLSEECSKRGIRLIHISTDCVFSGKKGNYCEEDKPDPLDLYGLSKWLGEVTRPPHLTIRTSFIGRELFTQYGLLEWFLKQKGKIHGYKKVYFTGLTTQVLSRVILALVNHPKITGLLHVYGQKISKHNLLKLMQKIFKKNDISIEPDEEVKIDRSLYSNRNIQLPYHIPPMEEMLKEMQSEVVI